MNEPVLPVGSVETTYFANAECWVTLYIGYSLAVILLQFSLLIKYTYLVIVMRLTGTESFRLTV